MGDRTSSKRLGDFVIHVDMDHKGFYRGRQAMGDGYRGWHYHLESEYLTPIQIILLLEIELLGLGARCVEVEPERLYVGFIELNPRFYRFFTQDEKTCVLWIGQHGKLHVEANKRKIYAKCIFKKADLVRLVEKWAERIEKHDCPFYKPEIETSPIISCDYCVYFQETCLIEQTRLQIKSEMEESARNLSVHHQDTGVKINE